MPDSQAHGRLDELLSELPSAWSTGTLGTLFDIQQGKALSPDARKGGTPQSFLRTANVFWGRIDLSKLDAMSFSPEEEERLALRNRDLLICEGGDIGRTAMWNGGLSGCYYQNHLHRLRRKDDSVVPEFVMLWMEFAVSQRNLYEGAGNKTTIPNLSKGRLSAFRIPLPPPAEQREIARLLLTVRSAKEATEKVVAATRELKRSLTRHMFIHGPVPTKEAAACETEETDIGPIRKGWAIRSLAEICEKPTYGVTASANANPVGPKFLRITDIQDGRVVWESVPYCECTTKELTKSKLQRGDIVIARIGATTGKAYVIESCPEAVFASYLIRVRAKDPTDAHYIRCFMEGPAYWAQIDANKGGRLKGGVSIPVLQGLRLPWPSKEERSAIAAALRSVDHKILDEERRARALDAMFMSLLDQLVTGRLRVRATTPAEAPA